MLPRVAVLGRPNVGKSSLFNRLAGRRLSIIDPAPGTTRDRIEAVVELHRGPGLGERGRGRLVELVDTGGWGVYTAEGRRLDNAGADLALLTPEIEAQILAAARSADLILLVVDARTGVLPLDEQVAQLLRRERLVERVMAVANKADDSSTEAEVPELSRLGFGVPLAVSAKSGRGIAKLRQALLERIESIRPQAPERATPSDGGGRGAGAKAVVAQESQRREVKIAIVGRRNAGKSSLVNALAGEPRVIVSEIAGTTRDSVDVRIERQGRAMVLIDTAGVRKRKSWDGDLEYYANLRTQESIRRADVCVLLVDATEPISQVEKNLAMKLVESWKPVVVAINKWDLVSRTLRPKDYTKYLEQELPSLSFAPIVCTSAARGTGLRDLVAMCFNLDAQAGHRETTGRVNAAVAQILRERGPTSSLGTKAKVLYVSQVDVRPPTLAMVVNKPRLFRGQYERYLENRLRDVLPFSEVPIRLIFSERRRESWAGSSASTAGSSSASSPGSASRAPPAARKGQARRGATRGARGRSR